MSETTTTMTTTQAQDITKLAAAAVQVMKALALVMTRETEVLKKKEFGALEALRQEKVKLVREYKTNMSLLTRDPEAVRAAPKESRAQLRVVGEKLSSAAHMNAQALRAAISGTQSLLQTIVTAARKENRPTECYGDPRSSPLMLGSYSPTCAPVAINRTA